MIWIILSKKKIVYEGMNKMNTCPFYILDFLHKDFFFLQIRALVF